MKETVKEYETVEKTEERIYCDECGGECTDGHEIVPSHRCESCVDDSDRFDSVEEAQEFYEDAFSADLSAGNMIALTLLYPFVLALSVEKRETSEAKGIILVTVGVLLWVVTPLLFYFV